MSTAATIAARAGVDAAQESFPPREVIARAEIAGAVGGVSPSNTPPATLQSDRLERATYRTVGGEDWLEVMLYLQWDTSKWEALTKALDRAREDAAAPRGKRDGFTTLPGSRGQWRVHAEGCMLGSGAGGVRCRWRLERDGIAFGIVARPDVHETRVSGYVRMTGETMLALGDAEDVWNRVVCWLAELGAEVRKATVSRVDLCVDLPGVSVAPFVEAFRDGRVIRRVQKVTEDQFTAPRRAKKTSAAAPAAPAERERIHWQGRTVTGLTLLGRAAVVRIYDKAIECTDLVKRAWMIARRWEGQEQRQAARVEFQLRREFLTARKLKPDARGQLNRPPIDTVQDYFERRGDLVRYLTSQWLRFVKEGFDARHTERAEDMELWRRVQEQFTAWADTYGAGASRAPLTRSQVKTSSLWKQVRGVVETVAARLHVQIDGADDFLGFLNSGLWEHIESDEALPHRVRRKTNTLAEVIDDSPAHALEPAPF